MAMVTSAVITSVAGSFYAGFANVADPSLFGATLSITIFTMLVIGGRRSITGAIFGAFFSTGDWKASVLIVVLIVLDMLIYYPFLKAHERTLEQQTAEGSN